MSRADDIRAEQIVGRFLDRNLYNGMSFERVRDQNRQINGIDVSLSCNGNVYRIDEKAKYTGGYLYSTGVPSFEINRVCRDGVRRAGWFAQDNDTDIIFFCYPKLRRGYKTVQDFLSDDNSISAVEIIKCDKRRIREYVEKFMSMDAVESYAESMARDHEYRDEIAIDGHVYLTMSDKFQEAPVNLVIKLDTLSALPGVKIKYIQER